MQFDEARLVTIPGEQYDYLHRIAQEIRELGGEAESDVYSAIEIDARLLELKSELVEAVLEMFTHGYEESDQTTSGIDVLDDTLDKSNCPFCGHGGDQLKIYSHQSFDPSALMYFVHCWHCRSIGPIGGTPELAAIMWNAPSTIPDADNVPDPVA